MLVGSWAAFWVHLYTYCLRAFFLCLVVLWMGGYEFVYLFLTPLYKEYNTSYHHSSRSSSWVNCPA